jgi:peptide/nickel transport system permease protein
MQQFNYILKRLLQMIPVLFIITIIIFWSIRLIPGNPAINVLGDKASPQAIAAMEKKMGLDQPIYVQYLRYLKGLLRLDLGNSIRMNSPVIELFRKRAVVTITYTFMATIFSLLFSLPLGYIAGMSNCGSVSKGINSAALVLLSLPGFWFAIQLLLLFGLKLRWFPVGGWGTTWPQHIYCMVLPAFVGSIDSVALLTRNIQSGVKNILRKDYVDFAMSKGLQKGVIRSRYVLKNVMITTSTLLSIRIAGMLGGSVVIESVFALPGLGSLLINGVLGRDYPVVQGTVLLFAVVVLLINLLTDILYSILDPRVKLQ